MVIFQVIIEGTGTRASRVRGHGLRNGLKYFESVMASNSGWRLDSGTVQAAGAQQEYWFSLRLRVDSPAQLWQAAALRCLSQADLSQDEVEDLIGPADDPSIADCLMLLALPERLPGCTRLDTRLEPVGAQEASMQPAMEPGVFERS